MKRFIFLLIFIFAVINLSWAVTAGQELQDLLNSVHSMKANFSQKNYSGKNTSARSLIGTMAILKPGRFRWDITTPSQVSMISNGKLLWIYDKNLAQVTIKKINQNEGSSPAMVLSNRIRLLANYFTVWKKNGWFYLNPKYKNDELKQVQLKFDGNRLEKMWIIDKLGQRSYLKFNNVQINQAINSSQFNFRPPKNVDIIR